MSEEEAAKYQHDEDNARRMLAAVSTPELDKLRDGVRTMRTSELVAGLARSDAIMKQVMPDVWQYSDEDEMLIGAAALIVLGDELDRRVPVPE
jgi:hypothetical protein